MQSDPKAQVQTPAPTAMPAIENSDGDVIVAVNLDTKESYFPAEPIGALLIRLNTLLDQYRATLLEIRTVIDRALKED